MEKETETITIPLKEYMSLKRRSDWLDCLESAGVDNWNGIDYAYEIWREEYPQHSDLD